MPETFSFTSLPTSTEAVEEAAQALVQKLRSHTPRSRVLLLLAGGSAVKLYNRVAEILEPEKLDLRNLIVALGDERWPEKNNTKDIFNTPLIDVITRLGGSFLAVPKATSLKTATEAYTQLLKTLLDNPQVFVIAIVGVGQDGHILSVNHDSDADHFASLFSGDKQFVGFESHATTAQFQHFPCRITLTLTGLQRVNYVISLVCGAEKLPMLQALKQPNDYAVNLMPALALLKKNGVLFTDHSI